MSLEELRDLLNLLDALAGKVELSEEEEKQYDKAVTVLTRAINEAQT